MNLFHLFIYLYIYLFIIVVISNVGQMCILSSCRSCSLYVTTSSTYSPWLLPSFKCYPSLFRPVVLIFGGLGALALCTARDE